MVVDLKTFSKKRNGLELYVCKTFYLLRVDIVVHMVSLNSHCLTDKHQTDGNPCSARLH